MREPRIDDVVRLTRDVPQMSLSRGDLGVVRSTWFAPTTVYEVEFQRIGLDHQLRAMLLPEQVELEDPQLVGDNAEQTRSHIGFGWG